MESHRRPDETQWAEFAQSGTRQVEARRVEAERAAAERIEARRAEVQRIAAKASGVKRRLSDRIEEAFDQACEQGQAEVAACMLKGLDLALLGGPTPWERRQAALGLLRTCQHRLEALRQAQTPKAGGTPGGTPDPAVTLRRHELPAKLAETAA